MQLETKNMANLSIISFQKIKESIKIDLMTDCNGFPKTFCIKNSKFKNF